MSQPSGGDIARWLNEGGHDTSDESRAHLLARIGEPDRAELAALGPEVDLEWADGSSRPWQGPQSPSDAEREHRAGGAALAPATTMSDPTGEEPLAILQRWEDSGGTWRLVRVDKHGAALELLTCSGGEVMGHIHTDDPDVLARVRRAEQP